MKLYTVLVFILMFPGLMSCAQKAASQVEFTVQPDTSFILPGTHDADDACYSADIDGPRLYYSGVTIKWTGDGYFYPAAIQIKFNSKELSGEYKCTLDENITTLLMDASTSAAVTTAYLEKDKTYILRNSPDLCAIECGQILLVDSEKAFKVAGEIKLIGYAMDAGKQTPHTARAVVFLQNLN